MATVCTPKRWTWLPEAPVDAVLKAWEGAGITSDEQSKNEANNGEFCGLISHKLNPRRLGTHKSGIDRVMLPQETEGGVSGFDGLKHQLTQGIMRTEIICSWVDECLSDLRRGPTCVSWDVPVIDVENWEFWGPKINC